MQQLTPNLWTNSSELFTYHSGILVSNGIAAVVDPGLKQSEINALAEFVRARKWNVTAVILTHGDWDHILGASAFPNARVIAQQEYVAKITKTAASIQRVIEKTPDLGITAPFTPPRADETFAERMTLQVGALTLELFHTPGHAPDHLFIQERANGILWSADLLSNEEIPFVNDHLGAIAKTFNNLSLEGVQWLVPCHGKATNDATEIRARLENDRAYIAELQTRVARAVAEAKGLEETKALCADIPYRQSVEDNRGAHQRNVENAYVELGGQVTEPVGWQRAQLEFDS